MKYPKFIKQGDTIGICAPSSGVGKFVQKFKRSIDNLHTYGYQTKETASVRNESEPSNSSIIRAKEVEELLLDKDVDMIMAATGGDFLFDILPHLTHLSFKQIQSGLWVLPIQLDLYIQLPPSTISQHSMVRMPVIITQHPPQII